MAGAFCPFYMLHLIKYGHSGISHAILFVMWEKKNTKTHLFRVSAVPNSDITICRLKPESLNLGLMKTPQIDLIQDF